VVLAFHHLSLLPALPTAEEFKSWSGPAQIASHYLEMVDQAQDKIRAALVVLSSSDSYPALFHCAAGKDRTGVLGSVVLGLLGVSEEDIVADYMLTAHATERMIKRIHDDHPERVKEMDGATPAILLTTPDTMEIFLSLFFERYGSFDGYAEAIGFEGGAQALQDVLLEV
jgi:protein-tyrosine phosphatase